MHKTVNCISMENVYQIQFKWNSNSLYHFDKFQTPVLKGSVNIYILGVCWMRSTILTISNIYKAHSEYNLVKRSPHSPFPGGGAGACMTSVFKCHCLIFDIQGPKFPLPCSLMKCLVALTDYTQNDHYFLSHKFRYDLWQVWGNFGNPRYWIRRNNREKAVLFPK